ncbi:hypothetical protein [Cytobacillus sp. NCCP-133]|uniref:hypothetical protein n=1 Tax=Cytobacillus sp. NCCP-133 TaxID=766848 RepID=UPI00222E33B9|nr:hypothetical protein [Cytobacillus sp. NCCP-133]GLB60582.1 hypothetical protein NCCP133_27140 [Cytobacillus sp. NCCP-133]
MENSDNIYPQLKEVITDPNRILFNIEDLCSYSFDASFGRFLPEFVVQVTSADEVPR